MMKSLLTSFTFFLFSSGCTSVVFQPDSYIYRTPTDYNLTYKEHTFINDDIRLNAWWIKPKIPSKGLLFVVHGNAQNMSAHFTSWVWLVASGYEVFIFDYRGYGASEGEPDLEEAISDVNIALDYLETQYKKPYILSGESLGGTLAINALALKARPQIQLAIIDSTFSDLEVLGTEIMRRSYLTWPFYPLAYPLLDGDYNAIDVVADIKTPLLFVAGSKDTTISPNHSWQLFDAATPPKLFWLDTKAGHINTFENPYMQKELLEFLKAPKFSNHYDEMKIYR